MRLALLLVMVLLGVAFSVQLPRSHHVVHETRAIEPIHWMKTSRVDSNSVIPMSFGLVQQNLHKLEEMLMSVSHPESPSYAQHFTPKEVIDAFAPSEETIASVTNWLVDSGFSPDRLRLSPDKGWIRVNALISEVEKLLNTEYHIYTHPSGDLQIGCHNYSLPSHLRQHVDLIKPTVHFNHQPASDARPKHTRGVGRPFAGRGSSPEKSSNLKRAEPSRRSLPCNQLIDLDCLRSLYSFNYTPQATQSNSFGIVEVTPQAFLLSDLEGFFSEYADKSLLVRPQIVLINQGAVAQVNSSEQSTATIGESGLDLEYAMALTSPQNITLLQIGDQGSTGNPFSIWLDAVDDTYCDHDDSLPGSNGNGSCSVSSTAKLPNVVSISYGMNELQVMPTDAIRQCNEYAKLGLMGTTVLYASGDNGVAGLSDICLDNNVFSPTFPASCPYVTAVGATQLPSGPIVNDPETAWNRSGGGFSNIFALPEYQKFAVGNYSQIFLTPSPFGPGQYNDSGNARGYPDLALVGGTPYAVFIDGQDRLLVGTSASTPVVASMIAMINDARIAQGKNTVGFLNPILYSLGFAPVTNDIITGSNPACNTTGFRAAPGWDPVTGVGTLNFAELLRFFTTET